MFTVSNPLKSGKYRRPVCFINLLKANNKINITHNFKKRGVYDLKNEHFAEASSLACRYILKLTSSRPSLAITLEALLALRLKINVKYFPQSVPYKFIV